MKKVYLIPELTIVKVELQQMIAESAALQFNSETGAGEAATEGEDATVLSRGSLWDEDEY